MIKISHEVPTAMLEESRKFNDYDYALVHLFETDPEYFAFYHASARSGREVLLDNSVFELGTAFSAERFAYWVNILEPARYIIPDVLGNSEETIQNIYDWNKNYPNVRGRKIGVVQGEDYESLTKCYQVVAEECDEIAISFNYQYYRDLVPDIEDKILAWSIGKKLLISRWLEEGVIREDKRHHILGCCLPQEYKFYANFEWIYSCDTSNPIVHGLLGKRYVNGSLPGKEGIKLADLIDTKPSKKQLEDIYFNIAEFRNNLTVD